MAKKAKLENIEPDMMGEGVFLNGGIKEMARRLKAQKAEKAQQDASSVKQSDGEHGPVHQKSSEKLVEPPPPAPKKRQKGSRPTLEELLEQYLIQGARGRNKNDTFYFSPELYEVFQDVWTKKKKQHGRGYKKSFLLIEGLFQLPEIQDELRKQKLIQ